MSEEKKEEKSVAPKAEVPANNIQWVGKRWRANKETGEKEFVPIPAPAFVVDGGTKIVLPAGIENGAFITEAARALALFPNDFKRPLVLKGAK